MFFCRWCFCRSCFRKSLLFAKIIANNLQCIDYIQCSNSVGYLKLFWQFRPELYVPNINKKKFQKFNVTLSSQKKWTDKSGYPSCTRIKIFYLFEFFSCKTNTMYSYILCTKLLNTMGQKIKNTKVVIKTWKKP